MKTSDIERIAREVAAHFRTFGGGRDSEYNPVVHALKDQPPSFAAGVLVEDVVRFVLKQAPASPQRPGHDPRPIIKAMLAELREEKRDYKRDSPWWHRIDGQQVALRELLEKLKEAKT